MIELALMYFFVTYVWGDLLSTDYVLNFGKKKHIKIIEGNPEYYGDAEVSLRMVIDKYLAVILSIVIAYYFRDYKGIWFFIGAMNLVSTWLLIKNTSFIKRHIKKYK